MRYGARVLTTRDNSSKVLPTFDRESRDARSGWLLKLSEVRCRPKPCLVQRSRKQQAYGSAESMDAAGRRIGG